MFWQRLLLRLRRPRVSSRSEVLPDGRVKKKISVSKPRALGNFIFPPNTTVFNAPLMLLVIFMLIMFFIFGEALSNRQQIYKMVTGSKAPAPAPLNGN